MTSVGRRTGAAALSLGLLICGSAAAPSALANTSHAASAHWRKTLTVPVRVKDAPKTGTITISVQHDSDFKHGVPQRFTEIPIKTVNFTHAGLYKVTVPVNKKVKSAATYPKAEAKYDGRAALQALGSGAGKSSTYSLAEWFYTTRPPSVVGQVGGTFYLTHWFPNATSA